MLELLEPIAIFTHVARAGSFSAAARRLGISKSKVSTQVADLEHKLGIQLIQRTTRSLSLTEAGNLLYVQGEELLRDADQAVASVHNLNDATRGVLKVGISQSFGTMHIIPALPEFMTRHPDLELQVSLLDHKVDVVSEGLDLLLTMSEQLPLGMVARPLMKCQFLLVASPGMLRPTVCRPGRSSWWSTTVWFITVNGMSTASGNSRRAMTTVR